MEIIKINMNSEAYKSLTRLLRDFNNFPGLTASQIAFFLTAIQFANESGFVEKKQLRKLSKKAENYKKLSRIMSEKGYFQKSKTHKGFYLRDPYQI